jgi:hypothetical protein
MTHLPKKLLIVGTVACALGAAQPAAAAVQPAGTGEPAYTNSQQNTQWFEWGSTSGIGGYRVRYDSCASRSTCSSGSVPRRGRSERGPSFARPVDGPQA